MRHVNYFADLQRYVEFYSQTLMKEIDDRFSVKFTFTLFQTPS